jgi:hypothetical protein
MLGRNDLTKEASASMVAPVARSTRDHKGLDPPESGVAKFLMLSNQFLLRGSKVLVRFRLGTQEDLGGCDVKGTEATVHGNGQG